VFRRQIWETRVEHPRDPTARYAAVMTNIDDDDDWPEPIHTDEERDRAEQAYAKTFDQRKRVLRYAYLVLGILVLVVVVVALVH